MKLTRTQWIAAAATLAYFALCVVASARKALWYDELFTFYVAELPDSTAILNALRGGMDNHPPISYLLGHYSMALVGHTPLGLRLPSMIAVWVGLVAVYRFAAARATPEAGACAVLFVASSVLFPYAYEARAYSLVFAGTCLTLLAWQSCLDEARRRWAPYLLFLGLSATLWTHFYAILVLAPLALGELARAFDRRRVDVPVALALVGGTCNVAPLYWFVKQTNVGFAVHFWARPGGIGSLMKTYDELFAGLWLPVTAILIPLLIRLLWSRRPQTLPASQGGAARWELTAVLGLLAVPCVMWVLAKLITHVFQFRYAFITLIGAAVMFAWVVVSIGDRKTARLAAFALVLLLPVPLMKARDNELRGTASTKSEIAYAARLAERFDAPVVFDSDALFLSAYYHAPAATAARLYHLTDVEWELRECDHDSNARAYLGLQRYHDVHAIDLQSFIEDHRRFVIVSRGLSDAYLLQRLLAEPGGHVELVSTDGPRLAYTATLPAVVTPRQR